MGFLDIRFFVQSINQSIIRTPINQSINQSINRSFIQTPINQSINQSTDQFFEHKAINQSTTWMETHFCGMQQNEKVFNTWHRKKSFMSPQLLLCGFFFTMHFSSGSRDVKSESLRKYSFLASVFVMRECFPSRSLQTNRMKTYYQQNCDLNSDKSLISAEGEMGTRNARKSHFKDALTGTRRRLCSRIVCAAMSSRNAVRILHKR